jgi:hypothetical protein
MKRVDIFNINNASDKKAFIMQMQTKLNQWFTAKKLINPSVYEIRSSPMMSITGSEYVIFNVCKKKKQE